MALEKGKQFHEKFFPAKQYPGTGECFCFTFQEEAAIINSYLLEINSRLFQGSGL